MIGTSNQGKIESVKRAFSKYFTEVEVIGVNVNTGVKEQPIEEETKEGAYNRLKNIKQYCLENQIDSDFYASIEAGVIELYGSYFNINIAVISDNTSKVSYGLSPAFPVPEKYLNTIKEKGLGELFNEIYGKDDNRHQKGGGIEVLSKHQISRIDLGELAFIMALTQWLNKEWSD